MAAHAEVARLLPCAPTEPIYYAHLYDTLIYPLASLLPLAALQKLGLNEPAILEILAVTSWLAVFGVGAVSLWMGQRLLRRRKSRSTGNRSSP